MQNNLKSGKTTARPSHIHHNNEGNYFQEGLVVIFVVVFIVICIIIFCEVGEGGGGGGLNLGENFYSKIGWD